MKKKLLLALLLAVTLFSVLPAGAWAVGPYQPPTLTVVVLGAPKGTEMSVTLRRDEEQFHSPLECERRLWENCYRLYRAGVWQIKDWYGNAYDFRDAELVLKNSEGEKRVPIPEGLLQPRGFNEVLTLHYRTGELCYGLPAWRAPLLIGIRLAAVLLIEGLFFYLKGFRDRKSWLLFTLINVLIHGGLNIYCSGWINVNPDMYAVFFIVVFISFLVEIAGFLLLVDEYGSDRLIGFLVPANLCSYAATLLMMNVLPL